MRVNGKTYPMWGQWVEKKESFVGATIEDLESPGIESTITDVRLLPSGTNSAMLSFSTAAGWSACCDVGYLAMSSPETGVVDLIASFGGWHMRITHFDQAFAV
jgi:hypothetical protein